MNPGTIIMEGQLLLAIPLALLAGLISFASPCILPLVPGYLGYVTGTSGESGGHREASTVSATRLRPVVGTLLFVLGFSIVFVLISAFAGTIGAVLIQWQDPLTRLSGVVVLVMGLVFVGQVSWFQRTLKIPLQPRTGLVGAPILGMIFAIGWTPCFGPTLIAISALSLQTGSSGRGALLGLVYCLGLGIPFLALALGFGWATRSVSFLRRHIRGVNVAGGVMLILLGVFMISGVWGIIMSRLGTTINGFLLPL
jgi:cytochrome c-type biogenesis protein